MRKIAFAAFAAVGLLSLPAMADENSGFYAGAGFGQATIKSDTVTIPDVGSFKFDDDDTAWKVFGGWRFNKYIAVELDYEDLGSPNDEFVFAVDGTDVTIKSDIGVTAFVPYVVGTFPIGMFELSGKIGYAFWDADIKVNAPAFPEVGEVNESDSGEDFAWGLGAGMTFFEQLNVKVEYESVDVSGDTVDGWWLTGAWRF